MRTHEIFDVHWSTAWLIMLIGGILSAATPPPPEAKEMAGKKVGELRSFGDVEFCWCPEGTFLMGSPRGERSRHYSEDQVTVKLTKGFWIGKTEATQGLWKTVMETQPWKGEKFVKEGANYPATFVSHGDVVTFCKRLTAREVKAGRLPAGWSYRLPTEAEWEYACRGGAKTAYSFGDDAGKLGEFAWLGENARYADEKYAHAVASKKPNAWGLYDMHGNVSEWCQDWYGSRLPGGTNPQGPGEGLGRSLRGGDWNYSKIRCRSARRIRCDASSRNFFIGFRVILGPSSSGGSRISQPDLAPKE